MRGSGSQIISTHSSRIPEPKNGLGGRDNFVSFILHAIIILVFCSKGRILTIIFTFLFVSKELNFEVCITSTINLIWLKTFCLLLFYFIITIIAFTIFKIQFSTFILSRFGRDLVLGGTSCMLEAHRALTKRNSSFILCLCEHYQARSGADHRRPKLSMRV